MKLNIQSLHFTANQDLTDFVTDTVNKLDHFYDKIEIANVSLKLESSATNDNKICEIRLAVPGPDLFAKRSGSSFEAATAEAVEALQQQIRKMKTKEAKMERKEVDPLGL